MNYLYCRVSTKAQHKNGYSLEQQESEMLTRYPDGIVYKESYTASTTDRPVLNEFIGVLKPNDLVCVTKLDRLARNTVEGIEIIQTMFQKGIAVHVLNLGLLEDTTMGKFFIATLLSIAEMERNTIIERTQAGKAIARTKAGFKDGRPEKFTTEQLRHAVSLLETHSYSEVERLTRISVSTLVRAKRKLAHDLL